MRLRARTAEVLAPARSVASIAFGVLAGRGPPGILPGTGVRKPARFLPVPTVFYFASLVLLRQAGMGIAAHVTLHAYGVLPVVAMAGLGVFALTLLETAVLAAPIVLRELLALRFHLGAFLPGGAADAVWLLVLMAGIALTVAVSQLGLALALVAQSLQDPLTGCSPRARITALLDLHFEVSARYGAPRAIASGLRRPSVRARLCRPVPDRAASVCQLPCFGARPVEQMDHRERLNTGAMAHASCFARARQAAMPARGALSQANWNASRLRGRCRHSNRCEGMEPSARLERPARPCGARARRSLD